MSCTATAVRTSQWWTVHHTLGVNVPQHVQLMESLDSAMEELSLKQKSESTAQL